MKTRLKMKETVIIVILSVFSVIQFSFPASAQQKEKETSQKATIVLKIKKDDSGKTTVIDTTFDLSDAASQKAFEEYMEKFEGGKGNPGDKMENVEVTVNIPDPPDSLDSETIENRIICIGKGGKHSRICIKNCNKGFDYNFDMPCNSEFSELPGCCEKYMQFGNLPDFENRIMEFGDSEETLSDIIGDIPMDRVTSYKIKDKKNGKRIIIDVENAPFVPKGKHHRMIIMGEPGNDRQIYLNDNPHHNVEKRVIIKSDKEGEEAK
jgi:hypothetical protein